MVPELGRLLWKGCALFPLECVISQPLLCWCLCRSAGRLSGPQMGMAEPHCRASAPAVPLRGLPCPSSAHSLHPTSSALRSQLIRVFLRAGPPSPWTVLSGLQCYPFRTPHQGELQNREMVSSYPAPHEAAVSLKAGTPCL